MKARTKLPLVLLAVLGLMIGAGLTLPGIAVGAPISVLIVESDGFPPDVELLATGLFSTVDVFSSSSGTPTLATLLAYDAVLAYTDGTPANPVALGDVLADYVDAGGRVSMATYGFSSPWSIQGRIATTGYAPLVNSGTNDSVSGNLVALVPTDPIFNGVNLSTLSYFHNGNFSHSNLDAGATLLATDGSGVNMIARNSSGNVIGLNLFPTVSPSYTGNNAELYQLVTNSLAPVPEPSTLLLLGTGLVGLAAYRRKRKA